MKRVDARSCAIKTRSVGEWYGNTHYSNLEVRDRIGNSVTRVNKDYMVLLVYEDC